MLSDLTFEELVEYVKGVGLPSFRAQQIFDAVYSGKQLNEISNISKDLKAFLHPFTISKINQSITQINSN